MESEQFYKQTTLPHIPGKKSESFDHPKQIGPYKIETLLNKGGMSYLYLGIHPEKELPLAIKVLSPQYMNRPDMVEHFLKEAEIIALTDHPNIIKLYGQGEWENGLYIAMEFVQGISLKQFIMQQNLSTRSSLEIILQVAYALLHLHTHGVIHRDLKPENILITEDGQVKVIDFGIAQLIDEEQQTRPSKKGQFLGTPSYMSPEQKKDPLNVTGSSDIFSLGVLAFELIVGKLSYGSIQLSLIPKGLQSIVEKALAQSTEKRYQDIVDFISDITNYLKSHPMQKDDSHRTDVKEIWTMLEKSHLDLLPASPPKWKPFRIGLVQSNTSSSLHSFYDFIRISNQSYLILNGEYQFNQVESLVYLGLLKGMIQTLISEYKNTKFQPIDFITTLNNLLISHKKNPQFYFQMLALFPEEDRLSFISCGYPPLIHLPHDRAAPHILTNDNPLLGSNSKHQFCEIEENWAEGASLVLHSFDPSNKEESSQTFQENLWKQILSPHLAPQAQAKTLFESLSNKFSSLKEERFKSVFTIQRL